MQSNDPTVQQWIDEANELVKDINKVAVEKKFKVASVYLAVCSLGTRYAIDNPGLWFETRKLIRGGRDKPSHIEKEMHRLSEKLKKTVQERDLARRDKNHAKDLNRQLISMIDDHIKIMQEYNDEFDDRLREAINGVAVALKKWKR